MIALLRAWPEAVLTMRGPLQPKAGSLLQAKAADLLRSGRLQVCDEYIEESQITRFLAGFDMGLCFYDLDERIRNDFNYVSSPSGKMFNYFAAGIPVLASAHVGLSPVSEFGAGVQSSSLDAQDLVAYGGIIMREHARFRAGALRAAVHFDFDSASAAFIDGMLGSSV